MARILVVPIYLDALVLDKPTAMVEAFADFSRLPYFDGQRDVNPDIPYLSEEILSQPFENQNLFLEAGVHLHWALPDALTRGTRRGQNKMAEFPAVPNRWLVTHGETQWLVESDYLYNPKSLPDDSPIPNQKINYPNYYSSDNETCPFHYMGRVKKLKPNENWKAVMEGPQNYLPKLTAVGYGEPAFAAFYPNCHSIFGLWDDTGMDPNNVRGTTYEVLGWYSNESQDYLSQWIQKFKADNNKSPSLKEQLAALIDSEAWQVSDPGKDTDPPIDRMVCFGKLTFASNADVNLDSQPDDSAAIAIGNTSTEALSAYLAGKIPSDDKSIIEDQLEALHLAGGLEKRRLDIGPKFKEARHTKGFRPVTAGHIWTLRPESSPHADQTVNRSDQVTLPIDLAELLNSLNDAQQAYDKASFEIESLQSQLFADWYKYMLCAYPPLDTPDDYPDIDEVKQFIEVNYLDSQAPLQQKMGKVGKLHSGEPDAAGQPTVRPDPSAVPTEEDLANKVADAVNALLDSGAMRDLQTVLESDIGDWKGFLDELKDSRYDSLKLPVISFDPNTDPQPQKKDIADFLDKLHSLTASRNFYSTVGNISNLSGASNDLIVKLKTSAGTPEMRQSSWLRLNRLLLESLFPKFIAHRPGYILKRVPAPRYWEPNDPVVLVAGDIAQPTDRHGPEGELQNDGLLQCSVASVTPADFESGAGLKKIRETITSKAQVWSNQPWNPIMLEWEVEFFPATLGNNLDSSTPRYDEDFVIRPENYALPYDGCDFDHASSVDVLDNAKVYSGRSILTPHAKIQLQAKIKDYLVEYIRVNLWDIFHKEKKPELNDQLPDKFDALWVASQFDYVIAWSRTAKDAQAQIQLSDYITLYMDAYDQLKGLNILAQSLGGFNQALLMHKQTFQLPAADPLGFEEYQTFTNLVGAAIGNINSNAPQPLNDFSPIRAGSMKLIKLRLIDSFGQVRDIALGGQTISTSETMPPHKTDSEHSVSLPPRLAQPARLNFRWLAADAVPTGGDEAEMNDHPATSPICGWILPNNLDDSLMVYEPNGQALGSLNESGWRSAPGRYPPVSIVDIPNPHLRKVVKYLYGQKCLFVISSVLVKELDQQRTPLALRDQFQNIKTPLGLNAQASVVQTGNKWKIVDGSRNYLILRSGDELKVYVQKADYAGDFSDFFDDFLTALENALENIDPENFAQHEALALLMGRPIAVVRASLNLELRGMPAINQDWNIFRQDMQATAIEKDWQGIEHPVRTTDNFTNVDFPIRIGEFEQLNDGLIGYWVEEDHGYKEDKFYAPQTTSEISNGNIKIHGSDDPAMINQSIDDPPHTLTMLLDPRGVVHATSGILPTKSIQIPADQFAEALRAIEVTFLSAPVITDIGAINLPLPDEPGYQWSWLEKENDVWSDETAIGSANPQATFASKQAIKEGWLKLRRGPDQKSS